MSEITQQQDSRRIFIDTLIELAAKDDKIVLIVPDVGFNYIEEFQKRFPTRYFNFGVTEASSTIIAASLALSGFRPFLYSMINFVVFRPFEMVRNAIVMHRAPVVLLGVAGSEKYKFLGFSHNMIIEDEDIYHLKPYMRCNVPALNEVRQSVIDAYDAKLPFYIRL